VKFKTDGFVINEGVYPGAWHWELNTIGGHPALKDRRVRLAINYAIDRDVISTSLFRGLAKPAGQLVSPAGNGFENTLQPYKFDLPQAKRLMAEAGYGNGGIKLKAALTAGGVLFSTAVAGMLKEIGIEVELTLTDFAVFVTKAQAGPIDDILVSRSTDGDVRDVDASYQFTGNNSDRPEARYSYKNDQMRSIYQTQRAETDPVKRLAMLKQIVKIVYDEAPMVPVYYPPLVWIHNTKVKDLEPGAQTDLNMLKIYKVK